MLYDIEAGGLEADTSYCYTFGYKWLGEKKAHTLSLLDYPQKRRSDDTGLMQAVVPIISSADLMVGWYSKGFDIKYLNTRMLDAGLPLLPPIPHVDLYFAAKVHLKLRSNRLASVQDFLQLPEEKTKLNLRLWMVARDGTDEERKSALKYIDHHCLKDVLVLELAYMKLRPFVKSHPHVGLMKGRLGGCHVCGEEKLQRRGFQVNRTKVLQRIQCQNCGAWSVK